MMEVIYLIAKRILHKIHIDYKLSDEKLSTYSNNKCIIVLHHVERDELTVQFFFYSSEINVFL